jgi:hypothetical protein
MVGLQVLVLNIMVRVHVPQQKIEHREYFLRGTWRGKGSGKHLFSRGGRFGKTVGFPEVLVPQVMDSKPGAI